MKNKKNQLKYVIIIISTIIIITLLYIIYLLFAPNNTKVSIYEAFHFLNKNEITFVINDEYIDTEHPPIIKEDIIYIPIQFIKEHIDKYIFWDENEDKVIITTEDKVIRMSTNNLNYYVNNQTFQLSLGLYKADGIAFLPYNLIGELYNVKMEFKEDTNILLVTLPDQKEKRTTINKSRIKVRFEPNIKSQILAETVGNEEIVIFDESGKFTKIRTSNGIIGYIATKYITNKINEETPVVINDDIKKEYESKAIEGKIVLLWDQIFNMEGNFSQFRRETHEGVNVLSPTWFTFDLDSLNGDIESLSDISYVNWAHAQGYQVWPLINDFSNSTELNVPHEILTSTEKREKAILQLLSLTSLYNLDGINIDFENVNSEDAEYYLQFLRELYPLFKENGLILSVDTYVPKPWTLHYNRGEIAKASDYIAIMAYDEHYGGSDSGPVASLGFVEDGIIETLKEVPKEQILLGIPTYNRIWREEITASGEIKITKTDTGMERAYSIFISEGVDFVWLEDIGTYYGEYSKIENGNEVIYKVWLEDEESIEAKLNLAIEYNLAGIAIWKRGLETIGFWDVVSKYLNTN